VRTRELLSCSLALAGTTGVGLPLLAPVVFTLAALLTGRGLHFDSLMPAELFPLVLGGGLLLLGAALRSRRRRGPIGGALGIAAAALAGSQALASASGLASGRSGPHGWPWVLVLSLLALYDLALLGLLAGGILLARDLFRKPGGKASR